MNLGGLLLPYFLIDSNVFGLFFILFHQRQKTVKVDTIDDDETDTLEYTLKKTWTFQPKLSNGLSGNETVTILHPGEIYNNHIALLKI